MAIVNLYSKRKNAKERPPSDVYTYDSIPKSLRSQLKQMINEGVNNVSSNYNSYQYLHIQRGTIKSAVSILRREYGRDELSRQHYQGELAELLGFIDECSVDEFLDCVELYARMIEIAPDLRSDEASSYIVEINHRLREAGLGYELIEAKIIRIDSTILHSEVLKPTLTILSSEVIYRGAEQEIHLAFEKFKQNDNKGAVHEALKAFESTMKAIIDKRNWGRDEGATASKLIAICLSNELIPSYMQTHFSALKSILESGVPTIRNKTSGHGQGSSIKNLDDHYASYTLYTALANIKLLIDCEKSMP